MTRRYGWAVLWIATTVYGCGAGKSTERTTPGPPPSEESSGPATLSWPTKSLPGSDAYRVQVPIDGAPSKGAEEPLVTIVAFSDFECPFCRRTAPILDRLLEAFPDDIRIVFRHNPLPFHADADPAARVAVEIFLSAGNEGFWRAHDQLFESQTNLDLPTLERVAAAAEVDAKQVQAIVYSDVHSEVITADKALARSVDARGTPTFFVNGRIVAGAQPYEVFLSIVKEERALARAAMARGTPRGALYDAVLAVSRPPRPPEQTAVATENQAPPESEHDRFNVPLEPNDPARGGAEPLVTIVAYSDYECPFCARIEPTLDELLERYGDDLRLIHRHNPLDYHTYAMPAAMAASEAYAQKGNEGFWAMHRLLFENQRSLDTATLEKLAKTVGLDVDRFKKALSRKNHKAAIEKQRASAQSYGATLTPSFYVNGIRLRGAHPLEEFVRIVDEEKARAQKLIEGGVPRKEVYAAAVRDGRGQVPTPGRPTQRVVRHAIPIPKHAPARGPADARVVIQIFSDFECPFCNRARPTIERIVQEYPKDVRVVWRNYPLPYHRQAIPAAHAAIEVFEQRGAEAFWKFHDALFEHQRSLNRETIEFLAEEIEGLDIERFRRALDGHAHRATIQSDLRSVRDAGVQIGTPSFFINGVLVQGAQPFAQFKRVIDAELGVESE